MTDEEARTFPIHPSDHHLLRSVPWSLVAPHSRQAIDNHSQTLQRLSERGGLSLRELYAVLNDQRLFPLSALPSTEESLRWIQKRLAALSAINSVGEGDRG